MMNKLKFFTLFLCICILCVGCFPQKSNVNITDKTPVNLMYYTIGAPDKDLELVNEKLNELLLDKADFTVTYKKTNWADYGDEMNAVFGSGEFDIAFATSVTQGNFLGNARRGAWLDLSDYLKNTEDGQSLYNTIDPRFWEGSQVNDAIYGIPTNKELSSPEHFIFSKKLVDKHQIDVSEITTLLELEPYLSKIKNSEPLSIPFWLDSESRNFFAIHKYEYVVSTQLPVMLRSTDTAPKVVNIFETKVGKETVETLRRFYQNGYINADASLLESNDTQNCNKMFVTMGSGGPYSESTWKSHFGIDIISNQISPSIATTESARGGMMVINTNTAYKAECLKFLNLVNTDEQIRNLLNYGVENVHYTLDENGQVNKTSNQYIGTSYTQGNWFILKTMVGEPQNKWSIYQEFNNQCISSSLLGFSPQTARLESQITAVMEVCDKYYTPLMTGTVDYTTYLPKFIEELKNAGIDDIVAEMQTQVDAFIDSK